MALISKAEFARLLADESGRPVESCQVSLSQWIAAGHLSEGEGLAGDLVDAELAARTLLGRLDLGQATGNGMATTLALEVLAGIESPAEEDESAVALWHRQKIEGQARTALANAARMELKAAQEAGDLLARQQAEAAMAQLLQAEITAIRQMLDDLADETAGLYGLDAAALRQAFRERLRQHRIARADAQQKVAAAMAAAGGEEQTDEQTAAQEVAEG